MALTFIYGAAGAGKSTYVQDMLIRMSGENPTGNYFLIVPDQFTMQTQADIVSRSKVRGILNIDVLSFSRFAYRIFEETGAPREMMLDDMGMSLVLRHVAGSVADKMPYIGRNLNKLGYINEVKSSILEFMQYGISVEDLDKLREGRANAMFAGKLHDLSIIYDAFVKFNKDRFITGGEQLDVLCDKLEMSHIVRDAVFVFDGFTGFTPVQERVIARLLGIAGDVYVTLTVSAPEKLFDEGGEEKLFYMSREAAKRLIDIAGDGIARGKDIDINELSKAGTDGGAAAKDSKGAAPGVPHRFLDSPGLAHLESNIFRYPYKVFDRETSDIEMFAADNIREETDEICRRIHRLIAEKGYAYRDIAIVTGDLENYADLFERRFEELGIPAFTDKTRGIRLNPFTEFLKSALNIIITDYSYDSVFHFLRAGFTDITAEEIDRFDNYVRSLNLRGKSAYHRDLTKTQRGMRNKDRALLDMDGFNETRRKLIGLIDVLDKPAVTAADHVNNLYGFLTANGSYERLRKLEDKFEAAGDTSKAREYGQIYRLVMTLLDTVVSLVGDIEMSVTEFYKIFDAGITEITVGTIPGNVDRIVVGDIERTRLREVKVLFFAGLNDGNVPSIKDNSGILSESDRLFFKDLGYRLKPSAREEMYRQKLYLYLNMCKPSDKLVLSYAGSDRDGKSLRPSYLMGIMKHMFGKLPVVYVKADAGADSFTGVSDSYRTFSVLLQKMSQGTACDEERELASALYDYYRENGSDEIFKDMTDAAFYEYIPAPLTKEIIRGIYGQVIEASVSRMELFARCAYAHFLQYGLSLREKPDHEFNAIDLGNIYHGVLERYSDLLNAKGKTIVSISDGESSDLIDRAVEDYASAYEQGMLSDDARSTYTITKIKRVMKRTVDTMRFQISRGSFSPAGVEVSFERMIDLGEDTKLKLRGKIDRIDICRRDNDVYVRIVDYKSSTHDINITNVYFGIEQQLEVYMAEAIRREKEKHPESKILPSALLYYKVDNPIVEESAPEKIEEAILKELKMQGIIWGASENILVNDSEAMSDNLVVPAKITKGEPDMSGKSMVDGEEMDNILDYTGRMVTRIGTMVKDGDISINPFRGEKLDSCAYCRFSDICPYDERLDGFYHRSDAAGEDNEYRSIVCQRGEENDYVFK